MEHKLNFNNNFYNEFINLKTENEKFNYFCNFSSIKFSFDNSKSEIIQEYLFHNLFFCFENQFDFNQTESVLNIAQNYLNTCFCNEKYSQELATQFFRDQIESTFLNNTILLEVTKLEKFLLFFVKNFVRHLSLYQTVLSTQQEETIQPQFLTIQTPLKFPPLQEANSSPRLES